MVINKEKNFVSAVLYVHNNEDIIEGFLQNLNKVLSFNFEKYEIICVDDNSTDGSLKKIKECANNLSQAVLSVINMSFYQGLEPSMNAGDDLAIGDFIYEFDNVFMDYDPKIIMEIYNTALKGFDIVSATSNIKRKSSKLFYNIFNRYSKSKYKLSTETFRVLSRRAINRVNSMNKTLPYRKAIYATCGLNLKTIKYEPIKEVNINVEKQLTDNRKDLAINSLILFTDITYKFSIAMTFIMMVATLIIAIYSVIIFVNRSPVAGWTTIMLLVSIAFFGVFSILAIIIKYLSVLVELVFKERKYTIESIEKITR